MPSNTVPSPIYALAGVADLAAEKLKKFAAHTPELRGRVQEIPSEVRKAAHDLPRDLQNFATDIPSLAAEFQAKARGFKVSQMSERVRHNVDAAQDKAAGVYDHLVERGQKAAQGRAESDSEAAKPGTSPATRPDAEPAVRKPVAKKTVAKKAAAEKPSEDKTAE